MQASIRKTIALALALAAVAAPSAEAGDHHADVLGQRAEAGAVLAPEIERARENGLAREQLEAALTRRGMALNRAFAEQPVTAPGDRFQWIDAGIGAGFAFGLVLIVAGASLVVRRRLAATA